MGVVIKYVFKITGSSLGGNDNNNNNNFIKLNINKIQYYTQNSKANRGVQL